MRTSPEETSFPLYRAIADSLRRAIAEGIHQPGTLLPSERELCDRFSVARGTVRNGLRLLVTEGLAVPVHGRGYEVLPPAAGHPRRLRNLSAQGRAQSRGRPPRARRHALGVRPTPGVLPLSPLGAPSVSRPATAPNTVAVPAAALWSAVFLLQTFGERADEGTAVRKAAITTAALLRQSGAAGVPTMWVQRK